jgi:hypothetical protein
MSRITPMSLSIRPEATSLPPKTQPADASAVSVERTQALTRRLDETLSARLASIRSRVQSDNPSHLGQMLDIEA